MTGNERKRGFWGRVKQGLHNISQIISVIIIPEIKDGTKDILNNVENRLIKVEKQFIKKMFALFMISLGGIFLIFALFFFLIDNLGWTKTTTFLVPGITIFTIGFLLKLSKSENE